MNQVRYTQVPNHPYASYAAVTDPHGRFFIHCACNACGDRSTKRCMNPARTNHWVLQYARLHAHGLTPRVARHR